MAEIASKRDANKENVPCDVKCLYTSGCVIMRVLTVFIVADCQQSLDCLEYGNY